jgi:membrane protease YdiL (CAAX protease family)
VPTMAQLTQMPVGQVTKWEEARSGRRRGRFWTALAAVELLLAAVAILGFRRAPHPWRMAAVVFGLVVVWSLLQFGLFRPMLNHLTGTTEDLSQFADLQGNLGLLAELLLLTWTVAAFGEELVYRGFIQTRITDVLGPNRVGIVVAVGSPRCCSGWPTASTAPSGWS